MSFRKRLLFKGLEALPRLVRDPLARRTLRLDAGPPGNLVVKIAETADELTQAFAVLHDAYVSEGLMKPDPCGLRATIYHALPDTAVAIAMLDGQVVATGSLIVETPLGVPMRSIIDYGEAVEPGCRVAEVSSLAVHRDFQSRQGRVLFPLLAFMYRYAVQVVGIEFFVIAVNPKRVSFYESILLFDRIGDGAVHAGYGFVNGAPAIGAYRDLRTYPQSLKRAYEGLGPRRDVFELLVARENPAFRFPERRYACAASTPLPLSVVDQVFNHATRVFDETDESQRVILRKLFPERYLAVLPPPGRGTLEIRAEVDRRFAMHTQGTIDGMLVPVRNASRAGVCIRAPSGRLQPLLRQGEQTLKVRLGGGQSKLAELRVEPLWQSQTGLAGLRIVSAGPDWEEMLSYLEDRAEKRGAAEAA